MRKELSLAHVEVEREGYFEAAKGGTLFLDEISEMPITLQGKLLEVLQEGTFYRVGGTKKIRADIRLIVATIAIWKRW